MKETLFIIIPIVVLIGLLLWGAIVSETKRQAWLDQHCTVIGKISGDVNVGYVSNGNGGMVTTVSPDKTTYKCDDGLTYTE